MAIFESSPLKIAIVGAGFSGTSLALNLCRLTKRPIHISLFEKRGCFGKGEAYSTPYPFHLLNVRANQMSAFADHPTHFIDWLKDNPYELYYGNETLPQNEQFVSRLSYGDYLQDLLYKAKQLGDLGKEHAFLALIAQEVIDVVPEGAQFRLILNDQTEKKVDKVVFALGNASPQSFPFPVSNEMNVIHHPWDYAAPSYIDKQDPVLIIGTGLSMIDTILTLHHQGHKGCIHTLSRHGLVPLPHVDHSPSLSLEKNLPQQLLPLLQLIRKQSKNLLRKGEDWRSLINALREDVPSLWMKTSEHDKKRFIRHLMSYWNVHRHRIHSQIYQLLASLGEQQQLHIYAGRVLAVSQGVATIKSRHSQSVIKKEIKWLINCMGPSLTFAKSRNSLINALLNRGLASLDSLKLGFALGPTLALRDSEGKVSRELYTLGPPTKGVFWEATAVPEIRQQSLILAKHLLGLSRKNADRKNNINNYKETRL